MAFARILAAVILVTVWTEASLQQPPRDGRPPLRSAERALIEAHEHYKAQEWQDAAVRYEEALAANPALVTAHFYLANSYDNLHPPSRTGDPVNAYMQKAAQHYRMAAERDPSASVRKLAVEYLVAAYGPDKLNDPAEAEPIVRRLIAREPGEVAHYFALARVYEHAGFYQDAEYTLTQARHMKPADPAVLNELSGFYNRIGDFPRTMEALYAAAALQPNKPEAHQRVAVFYWEKAFRDPRLSREEKREYLSAGVAATDRALALDPDYVEALTYKNILLRLQANEETDQSIAAQLIAEADTLRNHAIELNRRRRP